MNDPIGYTRAFAPSAPDPNATSEPEIVCLAIDGVKLIRLREHHDARGALVELGRSSLLGTIAQVYRSTTSPDVVKGWHLHQIQTDRMFCGKGRVTVGLFNTSAKRGSKAADVIEVCLDERHPAVLIVPPGVAHGWYNPGPGDAEVYNLCSHQYDGTDEYRRPAGDGPFPGYPHNWRKRRDG